MTFEDKFFVRFKSSKEQIEKNLANALRDLEIAKKVNMRDVKFHYSYTALIKGGIALLSYSGGIEVTEKECQVFLDFAEKVLKKLKSVIQS